MPQLYKALIFKAPCNCLHSNLHKILSNSRKPFKERYQRNVLKTSFHQSSPLAYLTIHNYQNFQWIALPSNSSFQQIPTPLKIYTECKTPIKSLRRLKKLTRAYNLDIKITTLMTLAKRTNLQEPNPYPKWSTLTPVGQSRPIHNKLLSCTWPQLSNLVNCVGATPPINQTKPQG